MQILEKSNNFVSQTLLNASKKNELSEFVDIDLSREEDSVTSLAIAQSTETWATAFAGINSSTKDQHAGKNEHLRSFLLEYPQRRKTGAGGSTSEKKPATVSTETSKGETTALGKASLFKPSKAAKKETFQRVLRLSKKRKGNGPRLGAVATGLAPAGEIVLFGADTSRPGPNDIRGRIQLEDNQEAADVDIIELERRESEEGARFRVAYCTEYEVYITDVDYEKKDNGTLRQNIYSLPHSDTSASSKARPKLRCLRFITPQLLVVLQNNPQGKGAALFLLEISGIATLRKVLHRKIKSATALSITHLDASSPSEVDQHVIAVAGADSSITILTLDRFTSSPRGKLKFRSHSFLPSVHPTSITSLAFSTFIPPTTIWKDTPPQYVKLASTSIANTCVVHTLPLAPYPSPPKPDTPARYLLAPPVRSTFTQNSISMFVALFAIAIAAFFLQAFTEIRGGTPEYLGVKQWLPDTVHDLIARPYMFEDAASTAIMTPLSKVSEAGETPIQVIKSAASEAQTKLGLRGLLSQRNIGSDTSDNANHAIIIRHEDEENSLSAELRHPSQVVEGENKKWEELQKHEKEAWKKRLIDAGEWAVEEGESVLKGIFFSGLGAAVGAAAGGG